MKARAILTMMILVMALTGCAGLKQGLDEYPERQACDGVHAVYRGFPQPEKPQPYELGTWMQDKMDENRFRENREYVLAGSEGVSGKFLAAAGSAAQAASVLKNADVPASFSIDVSGGLGAAMSAAESSISGFASRGMAEMEKYRKK